MLIQDLMAMSNLLPDLTGVVGTFSLQGMGIATAVVSATGLLIGLFLGVASKQLEVEVDERETLVRDLLPGANCGGCGYAGCDACAKAIAEGKAGATVCPVANSKAHKAIAEVMGLEASEAEKKAAFVNCSGTCDRTQVNYKYYGVQDCKAAASIPGNGSMKCGYGCMGLGSCVRVCAFDAIHLIDGIAFVDKEKCTGCSMCVAECPNNLIELVPLPSRTIVACSSKDKGKDVKHYCTIGCIGCKLCVKACQYDAIHVEDNLAKIDYSKCTNCGACAKVCPVQVIMEQPA